MWDTEAPGRDRGERVSVDDSKPHVHACIRLCSEDTSVAFDRVFTKMAKPGFKFLIDLPVRNHWENVDLLRTSILNCFTAIFSEVDGVHSFATVAAELLENAIKYGRWQDPTAKLHVRVWGDDNAAHVEVEHPVDASSEDLHELLRTIEWLKTFPSAEHAYRAKLLEAATAASGVSRLGLARIAYEGGCQLHAVVDGDILRVTSVAKLQA